MLNVIELKFKRRQYNLSNYKVIMWKKDIKRFMIIVKVLKLHNFHVFVLIYIIKNNYF